MKRALSTDSNDHNQQPEKKGMNVFGIRNYEVLQCCINGVNPIAKSNAPCYSNNTQDKHTSWERLLLLNQQQYGEAKLQFLDHTYPPQESLCDHKTTEKEMLQAVLIEAEESFP